MQKLTFYTKLECHLCEEAYRMLMDVVNDIPLEIDVVDIIRTHNQDIKTKYFDRIPVIAKPGGQTELDWPFTTDELRIYLST